MGALGYMHLCKRNKADERGRLTGLQGVLTNLLKTKATYNDAPNTDMLNDFKTEGEEQELQIFNLACLVVATNNFCLNNKLGQGGFGPVYKGKLQNGQQIAVKRLSKSSGRGIEEFKNEVLLISKLQHRNLVKLLGCCIEGEENMLIYEYMPNRSLDAFLFDPGNKACLDWDKRFSIIGGIARGLLYLHRDSRLRVIHRDLKVSNILLDEEMIPKISDFGMARIFGGNQTMDNTIRVVGTIASTRSCERKRNNSFYNPEQPLNLLLHILDKDLGDLYSPSVVMKCIHIGRLCCLDFMLNYETDRPSPKEPPYSFPKIIEMSLVFHQFSAQITMSP
ncbi:hypothetical protein MKW92_035607 [Papaver armeniacum]|nr:hypothetical protein MKW92_035607 [Papaver armeniacum]